MNVTRLVTKGLGHYWRTNIAVTLGSAVGTAVLCGALLVGDSMRTSLRQFALGRLGKIDHALTSQRFFSSKLADGEGQATEGGISVAPMLSARGAATHAQSQARAGGVNVLGVDQRFWRFANEESLAEFEGPKPGEAVLSDALAAEIGAKPGDEIILRVAKSGDVSLETLLGRRDDATAGMRVRVARVLPANGLGGFSATPSQRPVLNAFVALADLQRVLDRKDQVNSVVAAGGSTQEVSDCVFAHLSLSDLGVRTITNRELRYLRFESESFLLEPPTEQAIIESAQSIGAAAIPVIAYLANSIAPTGIQEGDRIVPYSTVVAIDPHNIALTLSKGRSIKSPDASEILLNDWTADQMGVSLGDAIDIEYYVTGPLGELETRRNTLTYVGAVAMDDVATDRGFTPEYEGVTDTRSVADWDPPFPMDIKRIHDRDEAYWDRYRTAPKAFVGLQVGLSMWAEPQPRLGRYTSIRVAPPAESDMDAFADQLTAEVLKRIDPLEFGLSFQPVRAIAMVAGQGSTDFGMLFIGFSFFLIASAAMLVALLFRLSVERRSREVGMMLAIGFTPRRTFRVFVAQGTVLAAVGGLLGVAGSIGYAALMITGLKTWWSAAVSAPFLQLSVSPTSIAIGFLAGLIVACVAIGLSVRGLTRKAPAALLAGATEDNQLATPARTKSPLRLIAVALGVVAVTLAAYGTQLSGIAQAGTFFGCGFAILAAGLCGVRVFLTRRYRGGRPVTVQRSMWRLASRNIPRNPGRSVLTIGLIAAAVFLLIAVEAFRLNVQEVGGGADSGTGGFALLAESAGPLPYDPGDRDGRSSLGFRDPGDSVFDQMMIAPFRLRRGDETSCLNLYVPENPRIIGAPPEFIERGGFQFASTVAKNDAQHKNPWLLLNETLEDGAIPVIGDEAAVLWQMHSGLNKDLVITNGRGGPVTLRFVALLRNSVLQDELIVSDQNFVRLFPRIDGHAFFLIQTPAEKIAQVKAALERELSPYGFDATETAERLAQFLAVQNTYLTTFQVLGGIGLVLGSIGLAAVLLRNIWERRSELALMRAMGFVPRALGWMVLSENLILVLTGLGVGVACALVAVLPTIIHDPSSIPLRSVGWTLIAVVIFGGGASLTAIRGAIKAPLITNLRRE